jgi:hypothetical protein
MKTKVYKGRKHRALFDSDLPFRARVETPKNQYRRKPKFQAREWALEY